MERAYLQSSVLSVVRMYTARDEYDREIWALLWALYDLQKDVDKVLIPMLQGFMAEVEKCGLSITDLTRDPTRALELAQTSTWCTAGKPPKEFTGWRHIGGAEVLACLLHSIGVLVRRYGTLRYRVGSENLHRSSSGT